MLLEVGEDGQNTQDDHAIEVPSPIPMVAVVVVTELLSSVAVQVATTGVTAGREAVSLPVEVELAAVVSAIVELAPEEPSAELVDGEEPVPAPGIDAVSAAVEFGHGAPSVPVTDEMISVPVALVGQRQSLQPVKVVLLFPHGGLVVLVAINDSVIVIDVTVVSCNDPEVEVAFPNAVVEASIELDSEDNVDVREL